MKENFADALARILVHEGGFLNDRRDPGGATNFGVTQSVYSGYRLRRNRPLQRVEKISQAEVAEIYANNYAAKVRFDALPTGPDYVVFDMAVNSGPVQAVKLDRVLSGAPFAFGGALMQGRINPHVMLSDRILTIGKAVADRLNYVGPEWKPTRQAEDAGRAADRLIAEEVALQDRKWGIANERADASKAQMVDAEFAQIVLAMSREDVESTDDQKSEMVAFAQSCYPDDWSGFRNYSPEGSNVANLVVAAAYIRQEIKRRLALGEDPTRLPRTEAA